jgi:hypothetical protein
MHIGGEHKGAILAHNRHEDQRNSIPGLVNSEHAHFAKPDVYSA